MASNIDLHDEEVALGPWPRRLLHIPTMTSYAWKPGNRYGSFVEPAYNCLTYTWGRWKLQNGVRPEIKALEIHGVTWEIPRVDPICFTATQLLGVINRTTRGVDSRWIGDPELRSLHTEFLWIDIACIDQRDTEPRSAAEIGRQALIFKGARYVFAWLSSVPQTELDSAFRDLEHVEMIEQIAGSDFEMPESVYGIPYIPPEQDETPRVGQVSLEDSLALVYRAFRKLFDDPWFSSLWTLQEAFLRSDAMILSREGFSIQVPQMQVHATINDICAATEIFLDLEDSIIPTSYARTSLPEPYSEVLGLIKSSGMPAIGMENSMVMYTVSDFRTCTKPEDRIYGIQQIFGIRVGKSSLDQPRNLLYTVDELNTQFGDQLLRHHPVLSQMHTFTELAPQGKSWLISLSSATPAIFHYPALDSSSSNDTSQLCLKTTEIAGNTWATFTGRVCSFLVLHSSCSMFESTRKSEISSRRFPDRNVLMLYMDVTPELQASPEYKSQGYESVPWGIRQRNLGDWVSREFTDSELIVLQLGFSSKQKHSKLGLLLLRRHVPIIHYRRIGICSWDLSYLDESSTLSGIRSFLRGDGPLWRIKSGVFG